MMDFASKLIPDADSSEAPDFADMIAFRRLWAAVLLEHWRIAVAPRAADTLLERRQARSWFGSKGFFEVCDLAGIDGRAVMKEFALVMAGKPVRGRA